MEEHSEELKKQAWCVGKGKGWEAKILSWR